MVARPDPTTARGSPRRSPPRAGVLTVDPPALTTLPPERPWAQTDVDAAAAESLADEAKLSPRWARLLVSRGVRTVADARRFLEPSLQDVPDPSLMRGLDRAVLRLCDAILKKERVALYGDYDVDGVTSTTLLASFLRSLGVDARTYIPQRLSEGYGLNPGAVDTLAGEGTQLLITLDCGITAADEITRANAAGIDCIIVDHHRCPPELPPAYAVLNPHQPGCAYPDKGLAAVGVCFNLVVGVRRELRARGCFTGEGTTGALGAEPNLRRLLDLVALGTIADMVPLTGVNRTLVRFGLDELRLARRPGVRALLDVAAVRASRAASGDVAFKLGPRINAAGRLADADVGVRLLLSTSMEEARPLADRLEAANGARQRIEADVFAAAFLQVEALGSELPAALVVHDDSWHPGVVGIVASKLVEAFQRPTIVIGQGGRGSARTARGVHVYDAIARASAHLRKFGGHRAAAGLSLDASAIDAFRADFVAAVEVDPGREGGASELCYDDELRPEDVSLEGHTELAKLEPFGNGNPEPLFRLRGARISTARIVGKNHLKLRLSAGGRTLDAIAWKQGDLEPLLHPGRAVELVVNVDRSEFSGVETVELRVKDLHFV